MRVRVQNPEDYITATLKLERKMAEDFTKALNGKSKNSYIIEVMEDLSNIFNNKDLTEDFIYDSLKYVSKRKQMNNDNDKARLKRSVVSVKLKKSLYNSVMDVAANYGLTFSELIRRIIIKKIEG